jgi:chaperonin GroES
MSKTPNVRVLGGNILLKPEDPQEKTSIELPDAVREKQMESAPEAIVLAVGPGRVLESGERVPVGVDVGDRVFVAYHPQTCHGLKCDGEIYLVVTEQAILGVRTAPLTVTKEGQA